MAKFESEPRIRRAGKPDVLQPLIHEASVARLATMQPGTITTPSVLSLLVDAQELTNQKTNTKQGRMPQNQSELLLAQSILSGVLEAVNAGAIEGGEQEGDRVITLAPVEAAPIQPRQEEAVRYWRGIMQMIQARPALRVDSATIPWFGEQGALASADVPLTQPIRAVIRPIRDVEVVASAPAVRKDPATLHAEIMDIVLSGGSAYDAMTYSHEQLMISLRSSSIRKLLRGNPLYPQGEGEAQRSPESLLRALNSLITDKGFRAKLVSGMLDPRGAAEFQLLMAWLTPQEMLPEERRHTHEQNVLSVHSLLLRSILHDSTLDSQTREVGLGILRNLQQLSAESVTASQYFVLLSQSLLSNAYITYRENPGMGIQALIENNVIDHEIYQLYVSAMTLPEGDPREMVYPALFRRVLVHAMGQNLVDLMFQRDRQAEEDDVEHLRYQINLYTNVLDSRAFGGLVEQESEVLSRADALSVAQREQLGDLRTKVLAAMQGEGAVLTRIGPTDSPIVYTVVPFPEIRMLLGEQANLSFFGERRGDAMYYHFSVRLSPDTPPIGMSVRMGERVEITHWNPARWNDQDNEQLNGIIETTVFASLADAFTRRQRVREAARGIGLHVPETADENEPPQPDGKVREPSEAIPAVRARIEYVGGEAEPQISVSTETRSVSFSGTIRNFTGGEALLRLTRLAEELPHLAEEGAREPEITALTQELDAEIEELWPMVRGASEKHIGAQPVTTQELIAHAYTVEYHGKKKVVATPVQEYKANRRVRQPAQQRRLRAQVPSSGGVSLLGEFADILAN